LGAYLKKALLSANKLSYRCNKRAGFFVMVFKRSETMKKFNPIISFLLAILTLPVLSANNPMNTNSIITGNKIVVTQDRQVSSFHALKVSGGIDVELSQGNVLKLLVEADENLIALIRTEVKDGVLNIYHEGNIQNAKSIKIHLTFQQLDAITASGGCDIESQHQLGFAKLKMDLSGGCDIKLNCTAGSLVSKQSGGCDAEISGEAENGTFNVSGGCDLKAAELYLKKCTIDASGGSDVSVNVTGELNAKATGASDITYYGKPLKVLKSANGSSDINGK
jgi:hypothetical protein